MDEEQRQEQQWSQEGQPDELPPDMPDVHYLPEDWFDEPTPPPEPKPWASRPWVIAIAIVLIAALVLYYTIPILVPVREDKSKIPINEQVYTA